MPELMFFSLEDMFDKECFDFKSKGFLTGSKTNVVTFIILRLSLSLFEPNIYM